MIGSARPSPEPLPPGRARTVRGVHAGFSGLATGYLLWANYIVFTGGNAPLTPWHLSDASTGAGTFMLFIGDWLLLLLFQLTVNGPLDLLLTSLLLPARPPGATFHPAVPVLPATVHPAVPPRAAGYPRSDTTVVVGTPAIVIPRQQGWGPSPYPEWRKP